MRHHAALGSGTVYDRISAFAQLEMSAKLADRNGEKESLFQPK
jgi:hypothetical protein